MLCWLHSRLWRAFLVNILFIIYIYYTISAAQPKQRITTSTFLKEMMYNQIKFSYCITTKTNKTIKCRKNYYVLMLLVAVANSSSTGLGGGNVWPTIVCLFVSRITKNVIMFQTWLNCGSDLEYVLYILSVWSQLMLVPIARKGRHPCLQ